MKWSTARKIVDPFDVITTAGLTAIVYGVAHIYRPAAWIIGGIFAVACSTLLAAGWGKRITR
jgi:hypothetical protein